ncbi:hypothetical protein CTAYLR_004570 [Chrysophaeum taylorii]|uniref:Amino acid transporter transmembrane domain-containing protein n=1 Tax=Chrysophaeum taylorii TaxID=2483200 RepID=A0AAD7XLR3_9STRA|nr:hypothetical protein CTAYLR_004570 [Chrysophaeum taylorii]
MKADEAIKSPTSTTKAYGSVEDPAWGSPISGRQIITTLGSIAIFMNAIVGPGFLSLPKVYNDSGFAVPTILLVVGFFIAAQATIVRSETVALMPGNAEYTRVVEFCDPALKFVGRKAFVVSHVLFYVAAMSTVIASIVLVAEATDILLAHTFGRTYALTLNGSHPLTIQAWNLSQNCKKLTVCKPFFSGRQMRSNCFVSLGYVIAFAVLFPVSTDALSEGMSLQFLSFLVMSATIPTFVMKDVVKCVSSGPATLGFVQFGPRALGSSGVVLFNLMYGIFVSTWLTEKEPSVSVKQVVRQTSCVSCGMMVVYGAMGALGARKVAADGLLGDTEKGEPPVIFAAAIAFGFLVIASGIPVACVMARHNLLSCEMPPFVASALCVVLPWSTAWLFAAPIAYRALVNYSGLFVVSWLALWMPFFLLLAKLDPLPAVRTFSIAKYLAWFGRQLLAPRDDDVQTAISPLPPSLMPYSRRIYAWTLLLITLWILLSLFGYIVWAIAELVLGAEHHKLDGYH